MFFLKNCLFILTLLIITPSYAVNVEEYRSAVFDITLGSILCYMGIFCPPSIYKLVYPESDEEIERSDPARQKAKKRAFCYSLLLSSLLITSGITLLTTTIHER